MEKINPDENTKAVLGSEKKFSAKLIAIVSLGIIVETYDSGLYGALVGVFATQFFPASDRYSSLMSAFGVLAVGVIARILGGFLFGVISDRMGRMLALRLSVGTMIVVNLLLASLPVYRTIGFWAPIFLAALRLLQGLSSGGQFSTAMTVIIQQALPHRRGLATGWLNSAVIVGFLIGSGLAALLSSLLTPAQFSSWGWRLLFLAGVLPGICSLSVGQHIFKLTENLEAPATASVQSLLKEILSTQWGNMLRTVGGSAVFLLGFWIPFVYVPLMVQERGLLPMNYELTLNTGCLLLTCILGPPAGWLADRFGSRRLLLLTGLPAALAAPLIFYFFKLGHSAYIIVGQLLLALLLAIPNTVALLPIISRIPNRIRSTTFALSYNFANIVFGSGSLPFTIYMVKHTGTLVAAGWILCGGGGLSLWSWLSCTRES